VAAISTAPLYAQGQPDVAKLKALLQKMNELEKQLGPEYPAPPLE
jgi:hypothetical protein